MPVIREHPTRKFFVDNAISDSLDESSMLRLDPKEKLKVDEQDFIFLNSTLTLPKAIVEIPIKP